MPTSTYNNFLFIGNLSSLDTDESDWDNENDGAILGTYENTGLDIVTVENVDVDDDGVIMDDEGATGDYLTYDTGSGVTSSALDSTSIFNAIVTEQDGTTHNVEVLVIQTANGDTFLGDLADSGFAGSLSNLDIQSVQLTSAHSSNYSGYHADNQFDVDNTTICFAAGTLIETEHGERRVETLTAGDRILTADRGYQPILWIGGSRIHAPNHQAPITFEAGALGAGQPAQRLSVSPQHRMLIRSRIAMRMFGVNEVLVPAKRLLQLQGVHQAPGDKPVWYWHILFENHELVRANGAWSESLLLGSEAMKCLSKRAVSEIKSLLPERFEQAAALKTARKIPIGRMQKKLAERHQKNHRSLVEPEGFVPFFQSAKLRGDVSEVPPHLN